MKKYHALLTLSVLFLIFSVIFGISCSKSETPSNPEQSQNPTPVPTVKVQVEMQIPSDAIGKNYQINFDKDIYLYGGEAPYTVTGTCSGNYLCITVTVNQGNYCLSAHIDKNSSNFVSIGNYLGIWGGLWPSDWPSTPNFSAVPVTYSPAVYAYVTLVAATQTNVSIYNYLPGTFYTPYKYKIFIDSDSNTYNGFITLFNDDLPTNQDYATGNLIVMSPGTYYIYSHIDINPPGSIDPGDIFGYYNDVTLTPQLTPPPMPNAAITSISSIQNFTFAIDEIPVPTNTPIPTSTYTFTPTNTSTPTPTDTPDCSSDSFEPNDNSFSTTNSIYFNLAFAPTATVQWHNIHTAGDVDYIQISLDNMSDNDFNGELVFETSPGISSGDTYMELYNSGESLIASDDDSGTGNYSKIIYSISIPAHTYSIVYYIKIKQKNNNQTICSYNFSATVH